MQQDVVDTACGWVHGDDTTAGFMTSGGTESLVLAVRSAQKRAQREGRNLSRMNVVLPSSAHAALEKGADYFQVESRRVAVGTDWRADVNAMSDAIDDETILVVGSAPQYPQGVVDPIAEIASLAKERNINCHVDACMGGVTLTYLERLGEDITPWDFRCDGVTSISIDTHQRARACYSTAISNCAAIKLSLQTIGLAACTAHREFWELNQVDQLRHHGLSCIT
jgi:glutamate/tyrosine decarboxylase-like PLP-dependent enzyme